MTRSQPSVVVPGNHDGVHLGHRALIGRARRIADESGLEVVALTFDPHPLAVLAPERAPVPLTTIARRLELLRLAGADEVMVARFDAEYAAQTAEQWVDRVLVHELAARAVVVGPDFQFGKGRGGTAERLAEMGKARGFWVRELGGVTAEGARVSSTRVREAIRAGDVVAAAAMLGRVHEVEGKVIEGHKRGRTIGVPTANLDCDPVLMPADGVYAVIARVLSPNPGLLLRGVANLGTRPTLAAGRSVEVHLFDFDRDIYGARMRVGFVSRIREEKKFSGLPELAAQIAADIDEARTRLRKEGPEWSAI